ncbi:nucleotide exchange factor GrpE [Tuwongella immobilis]|uniref:Protein GrpE n=1 Tax=Tuwongella immobilis TaxID=692036 RepID=A0A6C2YQ78_9BACT|nr:nucleotide exchange factor GrpE [Tuwongella immobilis]VIP03273.1 co-chaperone : Protein GrpE OS=Blastopirellula marina DSM 3645 GN=grpE PE=3 SV=1: GrpE [Tuwongella immobilis]VTS03907.1 co-chaperone : Protein GrpE OS=Blastopirellula marina DSM 3645 GN=grpE PE=3 SV=1: GrpE [Tuwongella immobilis]
MNTPNEPTDPNQIPVDAPVDETTIPVEPSMADLMQAKLTQTEQQRDEYLRMLKEKQAEFENYQKRAARDRDLERQYAQMPLARNLLPVFDNLERAVQAAKQAGDTGPLIQGVQATLLQWLDLFKRFGIHRMEPVGQPFNPNHHEAIMQQPSAEHPAGTVLMVVQSGFTIHDRVLRPAHVIISVAAPTPTE